MGWYVLQCKKGQEQAVIQSCRRNLDGDVLESAFIFRCERLWKSAGKWKLVERSMFPGYVFLQSSQPQRLMEELSFGCSFFRVMEEDMHMISLYQGEEAFLRSLCGDEHLLRLSYGYRDMKNGTSHITRGPLQSWQERIVRIDWHRRYAQLEVQLERRRAVVWAGVGISPEQPAV